MTEVSSQAKAMFFVPKNEATIYYAQGLSATIQQRLRADIGALPPGAERFVTGGWTIAAPQFVKKVRQNISWSSRVQVKLEAVKDPPLPSWETLLSGGIIPATPSQKPKGLLTYLDEWKGATPTNITISTDPLLPTRQLVAAGRIAYDVRWQAVLSTTRKLTRPKVDEVQLVDVVWG